jgi:hypothetical protein
MLLFFHELLSSVYVYVCVCMYVRMYVCMHMYVCMYLQFSYRKQMYVVQVFFDSSTLVDERSFETSAETNTGS